MSQLVMSNYDKENIFAKIIRKEIPCSPVYEDDTLIAINDIHPAAPVHILLLPKASYISFHDFTAHASDDEISRFFKTAHTIAKEAGLESSGYRLVMNHGSDAMQTVPHFHLHILGKRKLGGLVSEDPYHKRST